jgi:hypothetical protein
MWHCPHCSQTSSRRWNLMTHIGRKHQGIGQPVREDGTHSITMSNAAMQFIPDMMMSLQNNNNNYELNHKVHPNSFSSSSSLIKEEDTPKKRDAVDGWLEFWRPMARKMKEIQEIKNTINEFSSSSSSSLRQPSIITGLGQTPIIEPIISPVTRTALQPTTTTTTTAAATTTTTLASARSPQQQEQKNEKIIKLGTDLLTNLFISYTFKVPDFQRRLREGEGKVKDLVIAPIELSPTTPITTTPDNNNNSKKIEQANLSTENTKEEELEEDNHYLEGHPLSRHKLLIDNEHDDGAGVDHVHLDYDDGGKWVRGKDMFGNVIDACKVITDPPLEAKEYLLSNKAESGGENRNKKE